VSELIDIKCLLEKVDEYIHLERVLLVTGVQRWEWTQIDFQVSGISRTIVLEIHKADKFAVTNLT